MWSGIPPDLQLKKQFLACLSRFAISWLYGALLTFLCMTGTAIFTALFSASARYLMAKSGLDTGVVTLRYCSSTSWYRFLSILDQASLVLGLEAGLEDVLLVDIFRDKDSRIVLCAEALYATSKI